MNITTETTDAEDFLASEMARYSVTAGITKRSAVRLAIASAISEGVLAKGSLIPSEKRLTTVLGISLGTVQAALQQLQQSSIIVRRRGDGTRVASTESFGNETWHFRLLAKDNASPLRISKVDVDVEVTARRGPWSDFFSGYDRFVLIRRRLVMSQNVKVGAEMILPRALAPGMADIRPDELKMVNIRPFLAEKHGLLISRAEHQIETIVVNDLDARRLKLEPAALAFEITARAFYSDSKPGYWQRIVAPCSECRVTF